MKRKTALLFTGQGSQKTGMGKDLYENYQTAARIYNLLPPAERERMFYGDLEEISKTQHLQPLMVTHQLAIWSVLEEAGLRPDAVLGLSLGEYSALAAAGVMRIKDAIDLVTVRGRAMARASEAVPSGMCAVMGSDESRIAEITAEVRTPGTRTEETSSGREQHEREKNQASKNKAEKSGGRVYISNLNSSRQIVISGESGAVEAAAELLRGEGARILPLQVSGPFHTPYMEPAIPALREAFRAIETVPPRIPVFTNVTGRMMERGTDVADQMCAQMISPVRLLDCLRNMAALGIERVLEIGCGNVISSIVKKELPGVETHVIENLEGVRQFLNLMEQEEE